MTPELKSGFDVIINYFAIIPDITVRRRNYCNCFSKSSSQAELSESSQSSNSSPKTKSMPVCPTYPPRLCSSSTYVGVVIICLFSPTLFVFLTPVFIVYFLIKMNENCHYCGCSTNKILNCATVYPGLRSSTYFGPSKYYRHLSYSYIFVNKVIYKLSQTRCPS